MLRVPRWVSAVCTVWFMLKIHSPSGSLESQKMSDRGGLRDQPGVLSLQRVSPGDDAHVCCHSLLLEELSVVYEALLKGGPEAGPRFPPDCTLSTFGLCWFCFMSFHCNKSQLWAWLYAGAHVFSQQLLSVGEVSETPTESGTFFFLNKNRYWGSTKRTQEMV